MTDLPARHSECGETLSRSSGRAIATEIAAEVSAEVSAEAGAGYHVGDADVYCGEAPLEE